MYSRNELIGHIGNPPKSRTLPSGTVVTTFDMATEDEYKDKEGKWQKLTDWHRCEYFGHIAEYIRDTITSGSFVFVVGKNKTERWVGDDGVERYSTKVKGERFTPFYIKPIPENSDLAQQPNQSSAYDHSYEESLQNSVAPIENKESSRRTKNDIPSDTFEESLPDNFLNLPKT